MDLRVRRPDVPLEQKHSKPSASSGAGVTFVDVKEVGASHPLLHKQSLDVYGYTVHNERNDMRLTEFRHKGLLRLYTDGNPKGVSASHLDKVGKLLLALETALTLEQVGRFPGWKLHPLKGDMKGYWSLTVTGNWRMVFRYHEPTNTASDIDLIDYH